MTDASAFWVDGPSHGSLRTAALPEPGPGDVRVRTLWTGISRGTESVVFRGEVPPSEWQRMKAPFQEGEFAESVKYGYLNVGTVDEGPAGLVGHTVFTLYPHQSAFVVPAEAVALVPDGVPARRAVLAGAVETAVNVLWDAAPLVGDRITVIGAGMIGCAVARLARAVPAADVCLVDVDPGKAQVCERLGVAFSSPADAPRDRDLVIDTSASADGLQLAIDTAAPEGEIVEASWFGDRPVTVNLGGAFHSRRLTIRSSQVGMVAPRRRTGRTTQERLALALRLLNDDAFDALLTGESSWRDLPRTMAAIASGSEPGLCHTIDWRDAA